jgi:hypothetical protein
MRERLRGWLFKGVVGCGPCKGKKGGDALCGSLQ